MRGQKRWRKLVRHIAVVLVEGAAVTIALASPATADAASSTYTFKSAAGDTCTLVTSFQNTSPFSLSRPTATDVNAFGTITCSQPTDIGPWYSYLSSEGAGAVNLQPYAQFCSSCTSASDSVSQVLFTYGFATLYNGVRLTPVNPDDAWTSAPAACDPAVLPVLGGSNVVTCDTEDVEPITPFLGPLVNAQPQSPRRGG